MSKNSMQYFFSGVNKLEAFAIPIASFNTPVIDMSSFNNGWMVEVYRSLTDGTVRWSLESSNDNSNWQPYDPNADGSTQNLSIPDAVTQSIFYPNFIRIAFTISGAPTGTLTAFINKLNR